MGSGMFLYLSKKISMPNGLKVSSLSWNMEQGWLACGGETGLLKVIKLEPRVAIERKKSGSVAAPSNLSMNQTLEGHHGSVLAINWNQNYRKLTSSDEQGLIIVWVLHKGMWFDEMINNRDKSVVRDLRWSSDGQKICIVYEDGHVVLGNVDGNRLWGKTLDFHLTCVEWSPDCQFLLFCTTLGSCQIHDIKGNFVAKVGIHCTDKEVSQTSVVGIDWYNGLEGYSDPNAPTLAIAFQYGKIQLMRHEMDETPTILDCKMLTTCIKWSPDGEVLAIVGSDVSSNTKSPSSIVQLYSHNGIHLRTLRVPGSNASALSWEGGGLRLALAVDAYIYLANIQPQYKWASFGSNTFVYAFKERDHPDYSVMFWDIATSERYCKYVNHLLAICAVGEYSILATMGEDSEQYVLILCNAIGSPIDSKYIKIQPLYLAMNSIYLFVASEDHVYMWKYNTSLSSSTTMGVELKSNEEIGVLQELTFHIDNPYSVATKGVTEEEVSNENVDKICCVCCSDKVLMVGRESGKLHCYNVHGLQLKTKELLQCRPHTMALNCKSTRVAVIDINGMLYLYDLHVLPQEVEEAPGHIAKYTTKILNFERKDVWNMKWADDNPDLLAVMEKARMYILRGTEPEEPVSCTAYLCSFHDLQIQAVQLDEVMRQPKDPSKDHVFNHETKSLRDTQDMLSDVDIQDAYSYVEEHSHPRLWISLANHALEILDLSYAEKAFVKCKNYYGVQFVKGLHILKDKQKQKAEICVYFKKDKEAENIYRDMERKDLVVDMRVKLGDWVMLEKLIEEEENGNSEASMLLKLTWNNIGDHHKDMQRWDKGVLYYNKAKNGEKLAECLFAKGDWVSLGKLLESPNHFDCPLDLVSLAKKFEHVGICKHAVAAFVQGGDIRAAIGCCMDLNHWDMASALATQHAQFRSFVETTTAKYTKYLIKSGNPMHAVGVYSKGGQHLEAATILVQLAKQMATIKDSPIKVKKLYVLAALQADAHQSSVNYDKHNGMQQIHTFSKNPWHGAEAYHLWLLAHRELYKGHYNQALKISWWLQDYEDIIESDNIFSLIALTSLLDKNYVQCSNAMNRLESSPKNQRRPYDIYTQLAFSIFTRFSPIGHSKTTKCCQKCNVPIEDFQFKCSTSTCNSIYAICMDTGNLIVDEYCLQCGTCKHFFIYSKLHPRKYCSLCHSSLASVNTNKRSV